jgi:hypothetical protein
MLKMHEKTKFGEVTETEKARLWELIKEYEEIMEYDKRKIGKISLMKHRIEIEKDQKLIAQKRYKETEEKTKEIKKQVEELLSMGKIRKSRSPWASPITLVGKKSGNLRLCIDIRKVNEVTKNDSYPLPRIDELLEKY